MTFLLSRPLIITSLSNGHTGEGWLSLVGAATAHALILKTRVTVLYSFQKHVHMWVHHKPRRLDTAGISSISQRRLGLREAEFCPKLTQLYTEPGLALQPQFLPTTTINSGHLTGHSVER